MFCATQGMYGNGASLYIRTCGAEEYFVSENVTWIDGNFTKHTYVDLLWRGGGEKNCVCRFLWYKNSFL